MLKIKMCIRKNIVFFCMLSQHFSPVFLDRVERFFATISAFQIFVFFELIFFIYNISPLTDFSQMINKHELEHNLE